ncbi:hypothetical protein RRG08_019195 [Elysia crispata]|uniref:Uncharacterized protein n=1 Tax=Elysia crispata TaxID=231223 RepID=A0AAE1E4D2_9GAST|nr:hypothetical protein RRG08_019195 [Elysia crispata]
MVTSMFNSEKSGFLNGLMRRFERPDKRMVTEHVQPSPGSQTSLNQQLAMRDSSPLSYQAMGVTRNIMTVCHGVVTVGRGITG